MAVEHWFRWHHGTVNDPKWRVVAARASHAMSRTVTIASVVAVWAAMLECASQADPRGQLEAWDDEDVAAGLGLEIAEVIAIREAMQGKTVDDDRVSAWNERQPKREDGGAADRKARQREREKSRRQSVTDRDNGESHAESRTVTLEESREEENITPPIPPSGEGGAKPKIRKKGEGITFQQFVQACHDADEKALPANHSVFAFAVDSGIPREYLQLAWREFARQYRETKKTQAGVKGWRQKFENCVRRNWYKLWWFPEEGRCELTTAGVALKREREAEQERRKDEAAQGNAA